MNTFICGTVLAIKPSAAIEKSREMSIGEESCNPMEKISDVSEINELENFSDIVVDPAALLNDVLRDHLPSATSKEMGVGGG